MISIIAAMSENRVIGKDGKIPWHLSADLKRFKDLTIGHPIVMGRKTFESLGSKGLKERFNVVVTTKNSRELSIQSSEPVVLINSLECAIRVAKIYARKKGKDEIFIIGGAKIYEQTLALADKLYLTIIHADYQGDTFFPEIDWSNWHQSQENLYTCAPDFPLPYSFLIFDKIKKPLPWQGPTNQSES